MVSKLEIISYMKTDVYQEFSNLRSFLTMIIPLNDSDRHWIDTMLDMINQIMEDIESATELSDLADWFNVGELMENWDDFVKNFTRPYTQTLTKFVKLVCDKYDEDIESLSAESSNRKMGM